jgi:hypothetical protein
VTDVASLSLSFPTPARAKHDKRTAPLTTRGRWALPRARYSSRYDVLSPGKPTTDSGGILELALDPENGKRPCAE